MRIVPISKFASMAYCRRQIYLTLIKGIKPVRREIFHGIEQHNLSGKRDAKISPHTIINKASEPSSSLKFPFESLLTSFIYDSFLFIGKPDRVIKKGSQIYVEEEKYVKHSYGIFFESWKLQLLAYCHSLSEGETVFEYGNLRERIDFPEDEFLYYVTERDLETGETIRVYEPKKYNFEELEGSLRDFTAIMRSDTPPEVSNTSRCTNCSLSRACYL